MAAFFLVYQDAEPADELSEDSLFFAGAVSVPAESPLPEPVGSAALPGVEPDLVPPYPSAYQPLPFK